MAAKSLDLTHTTPPIHEITSEIDVIQTAVKRIMGEIHSPILIISGISYPVSSMIGAMISDFSRFDFEGNILAYTEYLHPPANCTSPTTLIPI